MNEAISGEDTGRPKTNSATGETARVRGGAQRKKDNMEEMEETEKQGEANGGVTQTRSGAPMAAGGAGTEAQKREQVNC